MHANAIPDAIVEFRSKGCLSEDWMDTRGIISVNPLGTVPKDERALHQQRAVIFNHEAIQQQWDTYQTRHDADNKQKANAEKALAAEAKRIERKRLTQEAKEREKERQKHLSKDEKKQEKEDKKLKREQKRQQKEDEHNARLAGYRSILGRL